MPIKPVISQEGDTWILRVDGPGAPQLYRCASERQVRHLEAVLGRPARAGRQPKGSTPSSRYLAH